MRFWKFWIFLLSHMCCVFPHMSHFCFWSCCVLDRFSGTSKENLKEFELIKGHEGYSIYINLETPSVFLKLKVMKDRIRKSGPQSYFENSALCTFNLHHSLNRKSETEYLWNYWYFLGLKQGTFTYYIITFGTVFFFFCSPFSYLST